MQYVFTEERIEIYTLFICIICALYFNWGSRKGATQLAWRFYEQVLNLSTKVITINIYCILPHIYWPYGSQGWLQICQGTTPSTWDAMNVRAQLKGISTQYSLKASSHRQMAMKGTEVAPSWATRLPSSKSNSQRFSIFRFRMPQVCASVHLRKWASTNELGK